MAVSLIFLCLIIISNGESPPSPSSQVHVPEVTEILDDSERTTEAVSPGRRPQQLAVSSSSRESPTNTSRGDFNPSVYLGEINEIQLESRKTTVLPFNNVQHIRLEGLIAADGDTDGVSYPYDYHTDYRYQDYHHLHQDDNSPGYAEGYVTVQVPSNTIYHTSETPNYHSGVEIQSKPIKYQYEPVYHQTYQHIPPSTPNYYHYTQLHKPELSMGKPETMVYLSSHHETSLMKTRKPPYKYYQQNDDTPIHYIEQGHAFPPQNTRISPWKKLIHLIGAFLPFGLLLAALKQPTVIKIDRNNTQGANQPNIVLSKWRGVELPLEHKADSGDACEDKSLCEIILSGAEENAQLIYSILWNFAIKSSDDEAQKNGLDEIFNGVKKKDCSVIKC